MELLGEVHLQERCRRFAEQLTLLQRQLIEIAVPQDLVLTHVTLDLRDLLRKLLSGFDSPGRVEHRPLALLAEEVHRHEGNDEARSKR